MHICSLCCQMLRVSHEPALLSEQSYHPKARAACPRLSHIAIGSMLHSTSAARPLGMYPARTEIASDTSGREPYDRAIPCLVLLLLLQW